MTLNGVIAVIMGYFTEFVKNTAYFCFIWFVSRATGHSNSRAVIAKLHT